MEHSNPLTTADVPGSGYFARQAVHYSRHRPLYPEELFGHLAGLCRNHELAWDAGTGSGQAAVGLAGHFERVLATDASDEQIAHARAHARVTYRRAPAHTSGLEDSSTDLVTVATALHWFDLEAFYAEVRRVSKPGGLIAVWGYQDTRVSPAADRVLARYRKEIVGQDWAFQVRLLTEQYRTVPFPFEEVPAPAHFVARLDMALEDVTGYLESWSATQRYRERTGRDPIAAIREDLAAAWGDPHTARVVEWPLFMRIGRMGSSSQMRG
ncbi:MAG TPA: class I SAM-dependent methyltransferase [Gemmatimonadaceae bacterium]|nr:class I SAM-dependent methyltransferase [Gemmatimonadaceae bacterium]